MVKNAQGGFPKKQIVDKLEEKDRGSNVLATTFADQQQYLALGWQGKSDHLHGKKRKVNFISTFLATDCTRTTAGVPTMKKRHDKDGNRVVPVYVNRPKLVEQYYGSQHGGMGMSAVDQNNKLWQYSLGVEEAIHMADP